jgi:Lecithin retinol acyltransferase
VSRGEWLLVADEEPPLGSHLVTPRRGYLHHGIYVGALNVVHYPGLAHGLRRGPVEEVSFTRFAHGQRVWVRSDAQCNFDVREVICRARSRVGEDRYRLLTNNCEHFCEWCLRGTARSFQVEALIARPRLTLLAILRLIIRGPCLCTYGERAVSGDVLHSFRAARPAFVPRSRSTTSDSTCFSGGLYLMRRMMVSLAACTLLAAAAYADDSGSSAPVAEDAQPDAILTLNGGSVAAGIGYTWGHGDLEYHNSSRHFSIKGVSIVDVGATNFSASGQVYNLKKLADFSGNYVAAGAGITIAGGGTALYLKNEHGVIVKLITMDVGLKFTLSADGVHVTLKK